MTRRFKNRQLNDKNATINDLKLYDEYFISLSFNEKASRKFKNRNHKSMNLIFLKTMLAQLERFIKLLKFLVDSALTEKSYSTFDFTFKKLFASFNVKLFTIDEFSQLIAAFSQNSSIVEFFILFLKFTIDESSQSTVVSF